MNKVKKTIAGRHMGIPSFSSVCMETSNVSLLHQVTHVLLRTLLLSCYIVNHTYLCVVLTFLHEQRGIVLVLCKRELCICGISSSSQLLHCQPAFYSHLGSLQDVCTLMCVLYTLPFMMCFDNDQLNLDKWK